jgi:hypothetical protein
MKSVRLAPEAVTETVGPAPCEHVREGAPEETLRVAYTNAADNFKVQGRLGMLGSCMARRLPPECAAEL